MIFANCMAYFKIQDKNFLKCPMQIQEAIDWSQTIRPINQFITNLKTNHTRGMLIFFFNNERAATNLLQLEQFGRKTVTCRWSMDTDIQQGVIGPIQCPLERGAANQKIERYKKMMEEYTSHWALCAERMLFLRNLGFRFTVYCPRSLHLMIL